MSKLQTKITYVTLFADESIHPRYEEALSRFAKEIGKHYPMYIGGKEVKSEDGEFEDRSPIDSSIIVGYFQRGTREHAREAIQAAKESFEKWADVGWKERVKVFRKAAEIIDQRKFEIASAITYEVGKNRLEALAECWEAIDAIKYYSNLVEEENGFVRKMGPGAPGEDCYLVMKPLGVWPVISPFNFPFMLANGMATGALITGNTVVLKPTSEAPLTGLLLYKVYRDAGVPEGVINFVTGPGSNFEEEFTSNKDVAGIAFTGSRDVGMRLFSSFMQKQPYPKPVVLEMGSKNPTIITEKGDLEKAVEGVVRAAFGYGGQKCSATSRIYVQSSIKRRFLSSLIKRIEKIKVGDPRERDTFMGPVINEAALKKYRKAVSDAKKAGGKILTGGKVLKGGIFSNGFYVEPTVIDNLPQDHRLFREELFVPLVVVDTFKTLEEAIKKANDTEYGLTAGIFSEDETEVNLFMKEIQFGVVYANRRGGSTTGAWPGAQSFVGWKASGATGKGVGGPNYLLTFMREQSQTFVKEKST
jgi:1-pyrroline-5-carboxylate dehydrogenase